MISETRLEQAMTFLATTDKEAADLKVDVARHEYYCDLVRSQVYLECEGSVKTREAMAEVSERVQNAEANRLKAMGAFEYVKAKRFTEERIVEVWRSMNANRRQGNIQ